MKLDHSAKRPYRVSFSSISSITSAVYVFSLKETTTKIVISEEFDPVDPKAHTSTAQRVPGYNLQTCGKMVHEIMQYITLFLTGEILP